MKLVRTSLAALAVLTVYACGTDATAPEVSSGLPGASAPRIGTPGGPLFDGSTYFGSGTKEDSTSTSTTSDSTLVAS